MKTLVTGGNGLVGSALKQLNKDWLYIDRRTCDLTNREDTLALFKTVQPDRLVHLAAYVPGFYKIDKVDSFAVNVRINENVLEAANAANVGKGIFCLSVNMLPDNPPYYPMDEKLIMEGSVSGPFAGYAYSKRMLELQCQNYNNQYNRQYFGIIPCNIYGKNDNLDSGRLIPNLTKQFRSAIQNNVNVTINGTGKPLRQFIYADDLARVISTLLDTYQKTEPLLCCGNEEVSIADLAHTIGKILNFENEIIFDTSKPDGVLKKTVVGSYIHNMFQFTSLEEGLKQVLL